MDDLVASADRETWYHYAMVYGKGSGSKAKPTSTNIITIVDPP